MRPASHADWTTPLARLVRNHPLFEHRSSLAASQRDRLLPPPAAISFGLGLCSPDSVSTAVPLDVLSMVLGADLVRRAVSARTSVVVIADSHALHNGLPQTEVHAQATRMARIVRRVARHCGLPLSVLHATDLHASSKHRQIHTEVRRAADANTPVYVSLETADTEFLRHTYGSLLKLGWSLGGPDEAARDERFFDACYRQWVGQQVAFAYVKAGRTLALDKPRMAPYVVSDPARRPLLDPEDDLQQKLTRAAEELPHDRYRAAVRYYGQVVSTFASYDRPLKGSLSERVQGLLARLFSPSAEGSQTEAAE